MLVNTVAHHQASPACVMITPKARPSGTSPKPTPAESRNTSWSVRIFMT
jgi:hypothetical protein